MPHFPKPFFRKSRNLWYVQIDGKQVNLGPDRDAAFREYHELMARPQTVPRPMRSDSVAAICDHYLEWVQKNRAADTYEWYRYRLQRFVKQHPDLTTAELRPHHVQTWTDSYSLSQTSCRNYMRSVKRCMKWARRQGYIDSNPIEDLEIPAGEAKEAYVSPQEFERLLELVRDQTLEDLLVVTYDCGCRPQESLRVTAENVDWPNHRWVFKVSKSKGKRISRVVYLTDRAFEITKRLTFAHPEGPLFHNSHGRPWTPDAVNCAIDRIRIRMAKLEMQRRGDAISESEIAALIPTLNPTQTQQGTVVPKPKFKLRWEAKQKLLSKRAAEMIPRYSLYALRHSWATNALQRGLDPVTVGVLMGHEDPSMLAKVYQHLSLNPQHLLDQLRKAVG